MSSQKTTKLLLHIWAHNDNVKRTEFNENFIKIDEELAKMPNESDLDAKIAAHANDTSKHITPEKAAIWDAKETPEGAQLKATKAKEDALAYVDDQIQLVTETGIPKLASYEYTLTATQDGQTDFDIPLSTYDNQNDTVILFKGRGILDKKDGDYQIRDFNSDGTYTIRLSSNEVVKSGDTLFLLIMKNVPIGPEGSINGAVLAVDSIPADRIKGGIASTGDKVTITDTGNYFTSDTVEGALQELGKALNGSNESIVTEVNKLYQM